MPPTVLGETVVNASAGSGSTSVTVPPGTEAVVAFGSHWHNSTPSFLSSITLAGSSLQGGPVDDQIDAREVHSDAAGVFICFKDVAVSGSQTFAWAWSSGGARTEGGGMILVWLDGINPTTPTRDFGLDSDTGVNAVEVTVDSETTDLILAMAMKFNDGATNVDISPGTEFVDNAVVNQQQYDVAVVPALAGTTLVGMANENYSTMAVISLPEEGGEGGEPASTFALFPPQIY